MIPVMQNPFNVSNYLILHVCLPWWRTSSQPALVTLYHSISFIVLVPHQILATAKMSRQSQNSWYYHAYSELSNKRDVWN